MSAQKIDANRVEIFGMIITLFQVDNKDKKFRFFKETLLLADIRMYVAFEILFLTLSNIKVYFND